MNKSVASLADFVSFGKMVDQSKHIYIYTDFVGSNKKIAA